ncbi:MAG TPA: STAS domain-containing protein [Solirubrobacteraceae bacterium]|nr:STAS domain-containing protein [Solirubrobacteraceae bacterium]
MSVPYLEIEETREGESVRLRLIGELDLASTRGLEARLRELGAAGQRVGIDLSGVTFIDSSGIRLLIHSLRDARRDGWELEVDQNISPHVRRILRLANVESLILGEVPG